MVFVIIFHRMSRGDVENNQLFFQMGVGDCDQQIQNRYRLEDLL